MAPCFPKNHNSNYAFCIVHVPSRHFLPGRRFISVHVICFVDSCDMILICNLLSVINSCFLTALVVRFLTRRFIWEYDPTLGECQSVAVPSRGGSAICILFRYRYWPCIYILLENIRVDTCICKVHSQGLRTFHFSCHWLNSILHMLEWIT